MRQIAFTGYMTAALVDVPDPQGALEPHEILGRTLVSLTSPGTELNAQYLGENFPAYPGYASVLEVEAVGAEVTDLRPGTIVFAERNHVERQRFPRAQAVIVPANLKPEIAVFARLMGVSMSTLNDAAAHPPARALVTGLGPVGNLAAQIFSYCGYEVTAVDPVEARRRVARESGLRDVRAAVEDDLVDKIALHLECSGHEQAALDGCKCVSKGGEVVLIGTPWRRRTDIPSHELLHTIFYRFVVVRSGWEWRIPRDPKDFAFNSFAENYRAALEWLAAGKIKVDHLATRYAPSQAQEVYSGLLDQSLPTLAAIFDWRP